MSELVNVSFDGATDPALTPIPFSTVTEGGGNDLKYNATGGVGGSPGMELVFAGVAAPCNGEIVHGTVTPAGNVPYASFDLAIVNTGLVLTQASDLFRAQLVTTPVCKVRIVGQAVASNYRLSVVDLIGGGGTVESTSVFAQGAAFKRILLHFHGPSNEYRLFVDGALEVTCSVGAALSAFDRENWGSIDLSIPSMAGSWFYDNLYVDDGESDPPPLTGLASGYLPPRGGGMGLGVNRM